ncbi:MAG: glycosyltransferase, partial [Actinobacteria bacterium]|nr:glycosyltransferase [Actinomycetota bacterium]
MKVALVHDYLTEMGGAERVVESLMSIFPEAPVYTSIYNPEVSSDRFSADNVRTSFMQQLTTGKESSKRLFPLFPLAFRGFDLAGFDVVLSSSSGFAHHVRPRREALHVCYCHTPPRFLWQSDLYFARQPQIRQLLGPVLPSFRRRDLQAARLVDAYVANSATVARRIEQTYGRKAEIIHPPVETSAFEPSTERSGRFLVVSRLLPYKRIGLAVEAATRASLPLDVIGDGPARPKLEQAAGPTVRFLGRQDDEVVRHAMARCIALVVPGSEDFGLTPVEAHASGRPVVAFASG